MIRSVVPALLAVLVHLTFHQHQPKFVAGILGLLWTPPLVVAAWLHGTSFSSLLLFGFVYHFSLAASITIYRLSPFHPLAKYPGPVLPRVTRLWTAYISYTGNQHRYYHSLHEQYGPAVRTGPNHLHIRDARAIPTILGPGRERWHKSQRYLTSRKDYSSPASLIATIDPQEHTQRRRLWEQGFTTASLKGYEDMITKRINQLVTVLETTKGTEMNLAKWLQFFSFDVMGDLAFSGRFNTLLSGTDEHGLIQLLNIAIGVSDALGTMPWVRPFMPILESPSAMKFGSLAKEIMLQRKANPAMRKDLFYYFFNEEEKAGRTPLELQTLISEAGLVIIAGSDTTSSALANAFFYMLANPSIYKRLQKEIDTAFPAHSEALDTSVLAGLPLLQAIINETTRLAPATANGSQRVPPPQGAAPFAVAGNVIPVDTTVQIPTWSLHRDPQYFYPDPEEFNPDRWLVDPKDQNPDKFRHDTRAFMPFSYGPTNCVGKNLALLELRMAIATIVRKFDISFAPGRSMSTEQWEDACSDRFVFKTGALPVVVSLRAH